MSTRSATFMKAGAMLGCLVFIIFSPINAIANDLPEELERLEVFVGDWDVVERVWSAPGEEPVEIRQTSKARFIMDGRFLEIRDRSIDGSYEFIGWHGYHTGKEKFINVAISNRRTDINPGECVFDEAGRYQCRIDGLNEPVEGDKNEVIRGVGVFEGADKYTWRNIRTLPDGTEFVLREVIYTRQETRSE